MFIMGPEPRDQRQPAFASNATELCTKVSRPLRTSQWAFGVKAVGLGPKLNSSLMRDSTCVRGRGHGGLRKHRLRAIIGAGYHPRVSEDVRSGSSENLRTTDYRRD